MNQWAGRIWGLCTGKDTSGQDMVEYALIAGFVAVAAGVFVPDISASVSTIFSRLASKLAEASA